MFLFLFRLVEREVVEVDVGQFLGEVFHHQVGDGELVCEPSVTVLFGEPVGTRLLTVYI